MQQVERRDVAKNGLSPVKGFAIVAVLALAGGTFLVLSKNDTKPPPPTPAADQPATTLTNAEAIETVRDLQELWFNAYRNLDVDLIDGFAAPNSDVAIAVTREITDLKKDNVTPLPKYEFRRMDVMKRSSVGVTVRGEVIASSRFTDAAGRDVTQGDRREVQTIVWLLVQVDSEWLLSKATILNAKPL